MAQLHKLLPAAVQRAAQAHSMHARLARALYNPLFARDRSKATSTMSMSHAFKLLALPRRCWASLCRPHHHSGLAIRRPLQR